MQLKVTCDQITAKFRVQTNVFKVFSNNFTMKLLRKQNASSKYVWIFVEWLFLNFHLNRNWCFCWLYSLQCKLVCARNAMLSRVDSDSSICNHKLSHVINIRNEFSGDPISPQHFHIHIFQLSWLTSFGTMYSNYCCWTGCWLCKRANVFVFGSICILLSLNRINCIN